MSTMLPACFFSLVEVLSPLAVELGILVVAMIGFTMLRTEVYSRVAQHRGAPSMMHKVFGMSKSVGDLPNKSLNKEAVDSLTGLPALVAWRKTQKRVPTPSQAWHNIITAFAEHEAGDVLVEEIVNHLKRHAQKMDVAGASLEILNVAARAGLVSALDGFLRAFRTSLGLYPCSKTYEILLGGYATAGDEGKVDEILETLRAEGKLPTKHGMSLAIKGFLKCCMADAVLRKVHEMQQYNFTVPRFAVTALLRLGTDMGRATEVFDAVLTDGIEVPLDAVNLLLVHCVKVNDLEFARRLHKQLESSQDQDPPVLAWESLLKIYASAGDALAFEIFECLKKAPGSFKDGLWINVILRCAESRLVRLAEEVVSYTREGGRITLTFYSSLMKVYARSNMYDKACDLYQIIRSDGLEPDNVMYGCLMRFAAECGRTDLSRQIFEKAPCIDLQNCMSQFRAAARDKDPERALAIYEQLKASELPLAKSSLSAAGNSVVDVCVMAGDMARARSVVDDLHKRQGVTVVTYNIMMKAYCRNRDLKGAEGLLKEMEAASVKPDDVSYNCLINLCVSSGRIPEAWKTIGIMDQKGIPVDGYTVSTMLKALKGAAGGSSAQNLRMALALLDRPGLDLCKDEVLLNTVLDTCVWHQDHHRLQSVLELQEKSGVAPSISTYSSLIKAYGALRKVQRCRELWTELTEFRGLSPNEITFGCFLDALVTNGKLEEGLQVFRKWQGHLRMNKVIYSTLMKGFTSSKMPERAMELWREMLADGVQMNTVVYNTVIDSQARAGAMDEIDELLTQMNADGIPRSVITYSMIIKGHCAKGNVEQALGVFRVMQENHLEPDTIIYNNLIECAIGQGKYDFVDSVLKEMETNRVVASNFTVGILVKMWGRRRRLDKAFEVLDTYPKKFGFTPNVASFTALLSACFADRQPDRAYETFKDMTAKHGVDVRAYGVMLGGLVQCGHLQSAAMIVREAYGLTGNAPGLTTGRKLDSAWLGNLLDAMSNNGSIEKLGIPLLQEMRAANVPIDGRIYARFLGQAASHEGRY